MSDETKRRRKEEKKTQRRTKGTAYRKNERQRDIENETKLASATERTEQTTRTGNAMKHT